MMNLSQTSSFVSDGDILVREIAEIEIPGWMRDEIDRLVN